MDFAAFYWGGDRQCRWNPGDGLGQELVLEMMPIDYIRQYLKDIRASWRRRGYCEIEERLVNALEFISEECQFGSMDSELKEIEDYLKGRKPPVQRVELECTFSPGGFV